MRHPVAADPIPDPMPALPEQLDKRRLLRRGALVLGIVIAAGLAIVLLPGLGSLRSRFAHARPQWLALGAALKVLSILSYVVLFRAVFCRRMSWRASLEIGVAELGANAVIPAGGAGGLALGAWALRRGGMSAARVARRTVAFFFLTSLANVGALIIVGLGLAIGLFPGHASLALTLIPAVVAAASILATIAIGRLAHRFVDRKGPKPRSRAAKVVAAIADGIDETLALIAERDRAVVVGSIGYLAFDVMILWATFHAYRSAPPLAIIWIGYLIGQLGGILPLPGGIGGIDGGLIATYTVYGISASSAAAAVLSYRLLALWIPVLLGAIAFASLRRLLRRERDELLFCPPDDQVDVGLGPVSPARAPATA